MALSKQAYRGCRDFFPKEMRVRNYIFEKMKFAAETFAFEPYDGPLLEEVELYKAKSGEELINDQIYAFYDRGERHVAIRPEMTPTLARMVANVHRETSKPLRWYAIPNLMRYEKPQKGRLREHWQFNCDIFGAPENLGEIEILSLAIHLMKNFGATETMFEILLNDRKIVDTVFTNLLKLDQAQCLKLYKVIDKAKKVSEEALSKMIGEIITEPTKQELFKSYLSLKSFEDLFAFLSQNNFSKEVENFKSFHKKLVNLGLDQFIQYDPTIVRGLDYYTGIVFEIFDKHPENRRAICGGGAYANLLQIFNEPALSGVGFGLGDVTLTDFLTTHNLLPNLMTATNDLYVTYQDAQCEDSVFKLVATLRESGAKVEFELAPMSMKKVFGAAEKKGHQFVTIMGSSELQNSEIQIKNLQTREAQNFKLNDITNILNFIKN